VYSVRKEALEEKDSENTDQQNQCCEKSLARDRETLFAHEFGVGSMTRNQKSLSG
jgi:hypothetical protein